MKKYTTYIIAIIPFFFFILGYIFSSFVMRSTVYQTPNLIGLKLSQALAVAAQNHATIKLLHEQECPGVEAETVISQKPCAGRLIKPNQAILISIAKEVTPLLTPDLKLKRLSDCEKNCKEMGIKLKWYPITYPLPAETCIGQIPQPNENLTNKKMTIYTAQEKSNIYIMPNFIQQKLNKVIQCFSSQDIKYSIFSEYEKIEPAHDDNFTVIDQKPKPGSLIQINKSLQIQLAVA